MGDASLLSFFEDTWTVLLVDGGEPTSLLLFESCGRYSGAEFGYELVCGFYPGRLSVAVQEGKFDDDVFWCVGFRHCVTASCVAWGRCWNYR